MGLEAKDAVGPELALVVVTDTEGAKLVVGRAEGAVGAGVHRAGTDPGIRAAEAGDVAGTAGDGGVAGQLLIPEESLTENGFLGGNWVLGRSRGRTQLGQERSTEGQEQNRARGERLHERPGWKLGRPEITLPTL